MAPPFGKLNLKIHVKDWLKDTFTAHSQLLPFLPNSLLFNDIAEKGCKYMKLTGMFICLRDFLWGYNFINFMLHIIYKIIGVQQLANFGE